MTSSQVLVRTPQAAASRYSLLLTTHSEEVRAAQRLRHLVFAGELGATLHSPEPGLDIDEFDDFCDHLVVREDATGEVVGTYRMLPPRARRRGRALRGGRVRPRRSRAAAATPWSRPAARACTPTTAAAPWSSSMWAGLARYMLLTGNAGSVGCAIVPLSDGGGTAAAVVDRVGGSAPGPAERTGCGPTSPGTPPASPGPSGTGCRRCCRATCGSARGSCGAPAHDPDFDCADFLVLLGLDRMGARHRRFFLGDAG